MRLSVLDQSTIVSGRSPDASIRESMELARHAENLGYHRYWLAEHHNSDSQARTAPEILIAAIAATTTRIRVGSAGVMLPYSHSGAERARIERIRETAIYGTPARVANRLRSLAAELDVSEIAMLTTVHDRNARRRSYELLAREFGLAPAATRDAVN